MEIVQIAKVVTVVLPDARRIAYVFPYCYNSAGVDAVTHIPLIKLRGSNLAEFNVPVQLGSVVEQVLVVHKCKRSCSERPSAEHDPSACAHRCRIMPTCPDHQLANCKSASCLKKPWHQRVVHAEKGTAWYVFDHDTGFQPDNPPQALGDCDFDE